PGMFNYKLGNFITTGEKSSGDNGYIYYTPFTEKGFATGTIPAGVEKFVISGSMPDPAKQFGYSLSEYLKIKQISIGGKVKLYSEAVFAKDTIRMMLLDLDSIVSPPLDSIIYWFNKKSINLYGEALIK